MIILDQTDRRPIYEQIVEKLSDLMLRGILSEHTPLPSVRNRAAELSINPNTVQRAYNELDRLGYTYSVKGKGSFVAELCSVREEQTKLLIKSFSEDVTKLYDAGVPAELLVKEINTIYGNNYSEGGSKQ